MTKDHESKIYQMVRDKGRPQEIMRLAGINPKEVSTCTFESASLVIAMTDRETIIEICHTPEMIDSSCDPTNPLFAEAHRPIVEEVC